MSASKLVNICELTVLILILMEYALWDVHDWRNSQIPVVLILILMEYALWAYKKMLEEYAKRES